MIINPADSVQFSADLHVARHASHIDLNADSILFASLTAQRGRKRLARLLSVVSFRQDRQRCQFFRFGLNKYLFLLLDVDTIGTLPLHAIITVVCPYAVAFIGNILKQMNRKKLSGRFIRMHALSHTYNIFTIYNEIAI